MLTNLNYIISYDIDISLHNNKRRLNMIECRQTVKKYSNILLVIIKNSAVERYCQ